jgi:hypothetical protein
MLVRVCAHELETTIAVDDAHIYVNILIAIIARRRPRSGCQQDAASSSRSFHFSMRDHFIASYTSPKVRCHYDEACEACAAYRSQRCLRQFQCVNSERFKCGRVQRTDVIIFTTPSKIIDV